MAIGAITRVKRPVQAPPGRSQARVKLAMQRNGRLTEPTLELLRNAGLEFESYGQRLFSSCRNFPLDIMYGRDDDIPEYVSSGTVDLGILGRNLVYEEGVQVEELLPLDFGYCALQLAVPRESRVATVEALDGKRVATSYPRSAARFFRERGLRVEIITLSGSVELAPALHIADGIVELSATGSTMLLHELVPIHTILESQAVLVASSQAMADESKKVHIGRLLTRLGSSISAKRYRYVMMNAPRAALSEIVRISPGLKSPTVMPLLDPDWVALHTAIREEDFWDVIERLRAAGATEILVTPIDKLFL